SNLLTRAASRPPSRLTFLCNSDEFGEGDLECGANADQHRQGRALLCPLNLTNVADIVAEAICQRLLTPPSLRSPFGQLRSNRLSDSRTVPFSISSDFLGHPLGSPIAP